MARKRLKKKLRKKVWRLLVAERLVQLTEAYARVARSILLYGGAEDD